MTAKRISRKVHPYATDEEKRYYLLEAREQASRNIYDDLMQLPNPCVVSIDENIKYMPNPRYGYMGDTVNGAFDEIEITIEYTPVEHKNIFIPNAIYLNPNNELFARGKENRFTKIMRKIQWILRKPESR